MEMRSTKNSSHRTYLKLGLDGVGRRTRDEQNPRHSYLVQLSTYLPRILGRLPLRFQLTNRLEDNMEKRPKVITLHIAAVFLLILCATNLYAQANFVYVNRND